MTFEEWFKQESERFSKNTNGEFSYTSEDEVEFRKVWEAAQSEIKKQLEFEKKQTESQRSMKILARNQRDAVTKTNNVLMKALETVNTVTEQPNSTIADLRDMTMRDEFAMAMRDKFAMAMRDKFAMAALSAMNIRESIATRTADTIALTAYLVADAMMEERKK